MKICATTASTDRSKSESAKTTTGDLPPSSNESRFSVGAAFAMIVDPVADSPVNETSCTSGCATSAAPAVSPKPWTTLKTPGGTPTSSNSAASRVAVSGDHSAGLRTIVLPAARHGAIRHVESISGAFHGMISAATPTGLWIV